MSLFTDPIFLRAIERVVLIISGTCLGFLGCRLFIRGIMAGKSASDAQSQLSTAVVSGVGPGLFLIVVAGLAVTGVSMTGGPQTPTARTRTTPRAMSQASDRAELLNQIALLKQTDDQRQAVIRGLRTQLALADTNNANQEAVVGQMRESRSAAGRDVNLDALNTQMTELSSMVEELQNENATLRAENQVLRAQNNSQ
jgi:hypothetical protein